ncbi:hypothetical protein GF323_00405 [Candidatus Woesearchaeota archaeon]|nr:hypothetical protein [Candidatus Woesearchaeota archaeon]
MDKNPKYFEGVLQLRSPSLEIIDFVAAEIEKKEIVWISKTVKQKNGIDIYISSNKFLKQLAKKLKSKFSGELVETRSLFSKNRQTSKPVYRGCVLFRNYNLKKGQIIKHRGDSIKIISLGRDILGRSMKNNKKVHIRFGELRG